MTYTVSVSFLNAKILTTSHIPNVRKVMLSFPEGCKCNGKKQTNKLHENARVLPFWFDQYWSMQLNKVLRVRRYRPMWSSYFFFSKKNHTSASKTILGLLVASVSFSSKPFPKENLSLNSQGILSRKTLQYRTCSLLKNLNFSAVHRTYLTF